MSDTVKAWINERQTIHAKATPGEWWWEGKSDEDWPQSENSLMAGKEPVVNGWGYDASGIDVEADDATYITDALNMFPRALNALNAVLELIEFMETDAENYLNAGHLHASEALLENAGDLRQAIEGAIND